VVASGKPGETGVGSGVLLSPVSVLSVLTRGDDSGADRKLLVSLAIRPEQAATLARAAQGTLDLVLLAAGGDRS